MSERIGSITIQRGDNLPILRAMADASFELIYIDPPFNTGKAQVREALRTARVDDDGRGGDGDGDGEAASGFGIPLPGAGNAAGSADIAIAARCSRVCPMRMHSRTISRSSSRG